MTSPEERFTDRVDDYARYRPGYPEHVAELVTRKAGLDESSAIADIGSGTGLLAELFLQRGHRVFGVEPNEAMRRAGERRLQRFDSFVSLEGSAEHTGLDEESVDVITAGQAFHWFDPARAPREFRRIIRPGGWIALVWNDRRTRETPFQVAYEQLIEKYAIDYHEVSHRRLAPKTICESLGVDSLDVYRFENRQRLSEEAFLGRVRSSSYMPPEDHPKFESMMSEFRGLYGMYAHGGAVTIDYDTVVLIGELKPA